MHDRAHPVGSPSKGVTANLADGTKFRLHRITASRAKIEAVAVLNPHHEVHLAMLLQQFGKRDKDLIGSRAGHLAIECEDQQAVCAVLDNPHAGAFGGRHVRQIAGPAFGFRHLGR